MSTRESDVQAAVDREMARGGVESEAPAPQPTMPTYKMVGDSKIATSSEHGKLWHSRRDQALSKRRQRLEDTAWRENIDYYNNHQVAYRLDSNGNWNRNDHISGKMLRGHSQTENIVFANTSSMVPAIYAKNPDVAVVNEGEDYEYPVPPDTLERLMNRVLQKRTTPGVNLKPHMRRAVVHTTLTNISYIEAGWTFRDQSSVQATEDLQRLSEELAKAKDVEVIRKIEGEINALEQTIDFLRPPGPWTKMRRSDQVLWDPDSDQEDRGDAKWCMVYDYISTSFILAKYANAKDGNMKQSPSEYRSIYEPTHVMNVNAGGETGHNRSMAAPDDIYAFSLLDDEEKSNYDYRYYGYEDEKAWRRALRTKVWYVWDRITRRLYMYNDKDWSWPIWVWDDPYNLEGFIPIYPLSFYTDPVEGVGKSEVSYYLDQQDTINEINSEFDKARYWARRKAYYNRNKVDRQDVERWLSDDGNDALGIDVPEGMTLQDILQTVVPPSMAFTELFDKAPVLQAVDRISSVTDVQRGAEFKTNTTNVAIEQYTSGMQTRLDEKIDAVEDCIGKVAWAIGQLCLQFMDQETVVQLIGVKKGSTWTNLAPEEIRGFYSMSVVGGSTTKPTSTAQKQIALQIGQVLGQFTQAAPQAVLTVMLRVFDRAFSEVQITDDDWALIHSAIGSTPVSGAGGSNQQQPQQAQDPIAQVEALIDSLPPNAKQALGMAMARGVPVREALERIAVAAQQQQPA